MADDAENLVRARLRDAIDSKGVDPTKLARDIDRGKDYVRDFLDGRKRSIGFAEASAIEKVLGMAPGWLNSPEPQTAIFRPPPVILGERDLPVYAAAEGGPGEMVISSDPIDHVARPWYLRSVKEGYAVLVTGDSMDPAFEAGDMAVVNPRLPPLRGKEAIFIAGEETGDFRASIKRYMRATEADWHVKQFNPPPGQKPDLKYPKKLWTKAYRVVGKYYGG